MKAVKARANELALLADTLGLAARLARALPASTDATQLEMIEALACAELSAKRLLLERAGQRRRARN